MTTKAQDRLNRLFDKIAAKAPWAAGTVTWLRAPENAIVRVPVALLLILGGIFSFLPLLGIWMLPLGLLLLAIDVVYLQEPITAFVIKSWRFVKETWRKIRQWWA